MAGQTTTQSNGAYSLTNLAPGTYTVYASSQNSLEKAVTTSVTVTAGKAATATDLNLTPTGNVKGKATLAGATSGNLGIVVYIAGTSFSAMTDNAGTFTITGVPANTGYTLVASKQGYDSVIVNVDVNAGATTSVTTMNLALHVSAAQPTTGAIAGTVTLEGGGYAAGVIVYLEGTGFLTATTDSGAYLMGNINPGSYVLWSSKEGFDPKSVQITVVVGEETRTNFYLLHSAKLPVPPSNPYPGDGAVNVPLTAILNWDMGRQSDEVICAIWLSESTTFSDEPNNWRVGGACGFGTLKPSTTYYWKVATKFSNSQELTFGPIWSFTTAASAGTTEIKINYDPWARNENATWTDLVIEFQKNHPEYTIIWASDADADLVWRRVNPRKLEGNGLADLSGSFNPSDFFAGALAVPQGSTAAIYVLPTKVTASHVMYVNRRILAQLNLEVPTTMTDLLNQVQTIRDAGYIPIAMSNGDGWPMQSCLLSTLAEREGGIQWFTSAVSGTASWSDAAFVRALDDILQLSTAGAFPPKINGMAYGEEGKLFINEQAVYLIDGDWKTGYFMGAMWDVQKSNIDYAAFPAVTNQQGQEGSVSVVMEGFAMKAATVDPVATGALAWINFFAGEEGSRIRFNRGDWTTAYNKLDTTGMDQMFVKYRQFLASHPYGWILDTVINSDSIGMLNAGIQAMMKGGGQNAPFPQDVADEFQGSFSQ